MTISRVVIVGGGNAGMQAADSLRKYGFEGAIDLICGEDHLPYQRPPLSKKFLQGDLAQDRLFLRPAKYYDTKNISLHLNTVVSQIDRVAKTVVTNAGKVFDYDALILATGARVRLLPGAGEDLGLLYIREIDDVRAVQERLGDRSRRIAMVGGGFIGLETAATLKSLGHSVTVIEAMQQIMPGLVAPELAGYFKSLHEMHGVTVLEKTLVTEVLRKGENYQLILEGSSVLEADIVIVGIGVVPNVDIATAVGLDENRGILVDEFARTSDPHIYAVGDCANGMHMRFGKHTRLESVQNAVDQATIAAKTITGNNEAYGALPWFWSDQYDVKLQMAGLSRGFDDCVIRGDMATGKFSICYFKNDSLIAVDSVNAIADHMAARRLLDADISLSRQQCADAGTPLKNHLT